MKTLPLQFVSRALSGIEQLSPKERADHYDLAADILTTFAPPGACAEEAAAAHKAAKSIREAESAQLLFKGMLQPTSGEATR